MSCNYHCLQCKWGKLRDGNISNAMPSLACPSLTQITQLWWTRAPVSSDANKGQNVFRILWKRFCLNPIIRITHTGKDKRPTYHEQPSWTIQTWFQHQNLYAAGTSLVAQGLRLPHFQTREAGGSIPGRETRSNLPQLRVKSLHAATNDPACCN